MDWKKIGANAIDSAIGFGTQVGTSLINNAIAQGNAEDQRDWLEKMWHMQNDYNNPSRMSDRMRAAGLNPYTMTGAQPAGSTGSPAQATTVPLESPLGAIQAIAQIRNLNSATNVQQSNLEKIIQETELVRIAVERGLMDNDQAKRIINELWTAYEEAGYSGPTGFSIKQGESAAAANDADAAYKRALAESENALRDARKALAEAQTEEARNAAKDRLLSAELKAIQRACLISDENRKKSLFPGDLEAQRLENTLKRYAKDMAASDADLKQLDDYIKSLWADPDKKTTWEERGLMLLDFIHTNLNLSGSKTWK